MPKGHYLNDSNYYVGVLPDGRVKFYCQESDYLEEYYELTNKREES
jgi:hypothetical protein